MSTRLWIAALIYPVVNAVLFGAAIIPLLSIDALSSQAASLFPFAVAGSLIVTAPISWMIAPRLRLRYWRQAGEKPRSS